MEHGVLGRARIENRQPHWRGLDGTLHQSQRLLFLAPPQQITRATAQEHRVERLGQRFIRAAGQRHLDRALGAQAHDDDRRLVDVHERADARADRDTVHHRQEGVEHDQVEIEPACQGQGLDAIRRVDDLDRDDVQDAPQQVARGGIACRHQDRGFLRRSRARFLFLRHRLDLGATPRTVCLDHVHIGPKRMSGQGWAVRYLAREEISS